MIYIYIYIYVYRHNPLREDRISYDGLNFRVTLISLSDFIHNGCRIYDLDDFVYNTCKIICSICIYDIYDSIHATVNMYIYYIYVYRYCII